MSDQLAQMGAEVGISDFALRWLEIDSAPRFLVDDRLRLLWRNSAAERLLRLCPDIDVRDGHMAVDGRSETGSLADLVAQAGEEVATLVVPCGGGDGHLLFQARRLYHGGSGSVALCVHQTGTGFEARYADFSRAFGLTSTEYLVVQQLMSGLNAVAIADNVGGSIATVRTHIRNIYHKMDVSSREMLFHRLRPFRIL